MSRTLLLVEDDEHLRLTLAENLEDEGYTIHLAETGEAATEILERECVHLIILDIMLPGVDGYTLCQQIRAAGHEMPVLMLTARTLEDDIVRGLDAGADDYLAKPYRLRELLARVTALLRRGQRAPAEVPAERRERFGAYTFDRKAHTLTHDGRGEIALTRTEFDMLGFMLQHAGEALSRDDILDAVWGADVVVDPRTVDNFVSNLKKKLHWAPGCGFALLTVRGVGYRMVLEG
ncbi:MAG: response regulator transcription factor [Bradymonadia bacterium]